MNERLPLKTNRSIVLSIVGLFVGACAIALVGPVLSYRSDLQETERLLRHRLEREAELFVLVLSSHVDQLEAELTRLATRPEVDPSDGVQHSEQELLSFAHEDSARFKRGMAVVDTAGGVVWSEPPELLDAEEGLGDRAWMHRVRAGQRAIDLFSNDQRFVVAVPIERGQAVVGAMLGLIDAATTGLPPEAKADGLHLVVLDETGDVLLSSPAVPPPATLLAGVERLLTQPQGGALGEHRFAVARTVGESGLRVVVVADEEEATGAVRRRFLRQMLSIALVQMGGVLLLALLSRRVARRLVQEERTFLKNERLVALGTASSLIAHEVKNALNGLRAATGLLGTDLLATGEETQLGLRSLRGEIARLSHISSLLLDFARPGQVQRQRVDLVVLIKEAIEAVAALPEAAEVRLETSVPDALWVSCDHLLISSAVQNLLRNAIEATVGARDMGQAIEPWVRLSLSQTPEEAVVAVEDNAGPMPSETKERLFKPFASGKAKGVGLGLVLARRAFEAHGGWLRHEERVLEKNAGSRFAGGLPSKEPQR